MRNYPVLILSASLTLAILFMIATIYQYLQANAQIVTSIQNQTNGHNWSSICINDVCTNGTCTNDSCETSIKCINGKCESSSSAITNKFPQIRERSSYSEFNNVIWVYHIANNGEYYSPKRRCLIILLLGYNDGSNTATITKVELFNCLLWHYWTNGISVIRKMEIKKFN